MPKGHVGSGLGTAPRSYRQNHEYSSKNIDLSDDGLDEWALYELRNARANLVYRAEQENFYARDAYARMRFMDNTLEDRRSIGDLRKNLEKTSAEPVDSSAAED